MTGALHRPRWLHLPWRGVREAKAQLANSRSEQADVRDLADEVRRLHAENHITRRIHLGMRGGSRE